MMNYIVIVVLTSLTIAQGSPSFEEVLEQNNELYNEGINVRAESKDSVHLTDDSTNLQEKDALDAISDTSKPYNAWENIIVPINGHTDLMNSMKNDRPFTVNSEFKFPHPVDDKGNIADIIVTVAKHGGHDNSFEYFVPKLLSIKQDLMGSVQCQNLICNINLLGLEITIGYDAANSGLYLSIKIAGSETLFETIPITGMLQCELVQLPKVPTLFCIHANNVQLSNERACMDLGFSFLGYSHTFPDICISISGKSN